jgi:hypothetical protein
MAVDGITQRLVAHCALWHSVVGWRGDVILGASFWWIRSGWRVVEGARGYAQMLWGYDED